jgi:hypothetical protein
MPSKSRKNRRAQAQRTYLQRAIVKNRDQVNSQAEPGVETPVSAFRAQSEKVSSSYGPASKGSASAVFIDTHFSRDIKWIGLVTGIIIVLLIISYYVFR